MVEAALTAWDRKFFPNIQPVPFPISLRTDTQYPDLEFVSSSIIYIYFSLLTVTGLYFFSIPNFQNFCYQSRSIARVDKSPKGYGDVVLRPNNKAIA